MSEHENRSNDVKTGFFRNRSRYLTNMMRPVGDFQEHRTFIGRMLSTIARAFRVVRGKEGLGDEGLDYKEISARWGITEANRPLVIRGHYIEFCLFMIIGVMGLFSIYSGLFGDGGILVAISRFFGGGLLVFIAIARSTILMWRLDVLKKKYWVTYGDWLRGR
jgi:hypothetical protein